MGPSIMAKTKRKPLGPKLPRLVRARDLLFAHTSFSRRGPRVSKQAQSKSDEFGADSSSKSSFSPSQVHPSRLPPYLRKNLDGDGKFNANSCFDPSTPIQLLSVDSSANSSELPAVEIPHKFQMFFGVLENWVPLL